MMPTVWAYLGSCLQMALADRIEGGGVGGGAAALVCPNSLQSAKRTLNAEFISVPGKEAQRTLYLTGKGRPVG